MAKQNCRADRRYELCTYAILLLVVAFVAIGQFAIRFGWTEEENWLRLFTGVPSMQLRDNAIQLSVATDCREIEMHFREPLKDRPFMAVKLGETPKYTIKSSDDFAWLAVEAKDELSLRNTKVSVILSDPNAPGLPQIRFIDAVRIDGRLVWLPEFYHKGLMRLGNNAHLYFPLQVENLSATLASLFGKYLIWLLQSVLITILSCQSILLILAYFVQTKGVTEYLQKENEPAVTLLDELSKNFAIPLGFLGTVVSVWYALESSGTDYRSFGQILEIIKVAVFTTVMGLMTRVICLFRSHFRGI